MYSIGTAPFRGVWVSGGDRCETATPTEAEAETDLAAYRLRFTLFRQHYTIILLLLQAYYYYYREDQSRIERAAITPTNHSRSSRDAGVWAC